MPRMSKQRRLEWSFFLDHRNRISYNPLCRGCIHGCKQSFRAIVVLCPALLVKTLETARLSCHDSLYPISREGGDIPSLST